MKLELNYKMRTLVVTVAVSVLLIGIGLFSEDIGVLGNMIIISVLVIMSPQIIFSYESYRTLKDLEANFPKLMTTLTESIRSGMPLHQAIINGGRYDYGKLTPEVKKMAMQLSWGITLDKVLEQLAERVKKSRRLYVSVRTIKEAYSSGGNVASTLEHIANNIDTLVDVEKERKSILNQYVILMYAIALIFVGIVAAINKFMVPIFQVTSQQGAAAGQATLGISNPCDNAVGPSLFVCDMYSGIAALFIKDTATLQGYYIALFFSMSALQAIFSGLIAGVISEGSVRAGLKHSLIMVLLVFGAFSLMVRLGFMT